MLQGIVNQDLDPAVALGIYSADGDRFTIYPLVDTGFRNELALPVAFIQKLKLRRGSDFTAKYANGSSEIIPSYLAEVDWNGSRKNVSVVAMEEPLIGMTLMLSLHLSIDVRVDGEVLIAP